jgi:hypothetical protein
MPEIAVRFDQYLFVGAIDCLQLGGQAVVLAAR